MSKKTVKCPKCGKTWQTDDALKVIISSCGAKYPLSCVKGVYRLEEFTS